MAVTYAASIAQARILVGDVLTPTRVSDAEMLAFAKDGVVEAVGLRNDLFKVDGTFNCVAGLVQTLPNPGRSLYIIDVYESIIAGVHVNMTECDLGALRRYRRSWMSDPAAQAENWARYPSDGGKRDDARFYVYPQAPGASQALNACWVEVPDQSTLVAGDAMPLTDDIAPAIQQYIAYRHEVINAEPAVKDRAAGFYANFRAQLKLTEIRQEA